VWDKNMRAIISCITPLSNEEIIAVLNDINWLPNTCIDNCNLASLKKNIDTQTTELLKNIPNEDTGVKDTTFVTIFDGYTKTWGIVTRTNQYRLTIRLKNPVVESLKQACESIVTLLRSSIPYKTLNKSYNSVSLTRRYCENIRKFKRYFNYFVSGGCQKPEKVSEENIPDDKKEKCKGKFYEKIDECKRDRVQKLFCGEPLFKFASIIHVLEKDSIHESFTGKIIYKSLIKATYYENRNQAVVVISAGIITLFLFIITSPLCNKFFTGDWGDWTLGGLERISTATLVTCFVGSLELILTWSHLIKVAPIKWYAK
jgi:hypothetical protein